MSPLRHSYHCIINPAPGLRVRTYLNQAFHKDVLFKIQRVMQKINFQAVQIIGIKSREDALKLRNKLRKYNPNFQSAFVKSVVKR